MRTLLLVDRARVARQVRGCLDGDELVHVRRLDEALAELRRTSFDVALVDPTLAGWDGMPAGERLRLASPELPIVLLDDVGDDDDDELDSHADAAVARDALEGDTLSRAIHTGIERRRTRCRLARMNHELAEANRRLEALATIDPLTELLNRRGLEKVLISELARARRTGAPMAAILVDCDNFKRINGRYGFSAGDVVLSEIARRLRAAVRPGDHLARIGGDEFLVLLPDTRPAEGLTAGERLRLAVGSHPIPLSARSVTVTVSAGLAAIPLGTHRVEELVLLTETVLAESKRRGKNRLVTGQLETNSLDEDSVDGEEEESIVDTIARGDCFRALVQPIYGLADERPVGRELLTRGPAGPFEMPEDFLRVAQVSEILCAVDLNCLRACLRRVSQCDDCERFQINLFPTTICETPVDELISMLQRVAPPEWFWFEVSEQQIVGDPGHLRGPFEALRDHGVKVGIDDVGFGRSGIETLVVLAPDFVKIDRRFTHGIGADRARQELLRRLLAVVTSLVPGVIAEGVERREDLEVLRELGVREAQGFLWDRP